MQQQRYDNGPPYVRQARVKTCQLSAVLLYVRQTDELIMHPYVRTQGGHLHANIRTYVCTTVLHMSRPPPLLPPPPPIPPLFSY